MLTVEVDGAERMCVVKLPTDNDGSRAFAVAGNAYAKELQARAPAGTRPFLSFFGVRPQCTAYPGFPRHVTKMSRAAPFIPALVVSLRCTAH